MKALLANAGEVIYASSGGFKPFTPTEVRNFLALYILQGLSPSPQVKQKFQPQSVDPVNGNDMVVSMFGRNAEKRHKMFKVCFCVQDPRKIVPPKTTHPNFKIDPFLKGADSFNSFMGPW